MSHEIVCVGRGPAVRMKDRGNLSHGIITVLHGDVIARSMLHRLTVASFLVGIALGIASERIGHPCFEHRLAVMGNDTVCRRGGCPIGQCNLCRAVVDVVFGGCLRVARGGVVRTDASEILRYRIVCLYGTSEGIPYGSPAYNGYLPAFSVRPYHACLFSLHGAHQTVGESINFNVALGCVMHRTGITTSRMILELNGIGLACGYLFRTENRALASHVVVGIAHLIAVEVGSL